MRVGDRLNLMEPAVAAEAWIDPFARHVAKHPIT
jgi:hypothetical protein